MTGTQFLSMCYNIYEAFGEVLLLSKQCESGLCNVDLGHICAHCREIEYLIAAFSERI